MELLDSGLPFFCLVQFENLDHALALVIEEDKVLAILLRAIDVLLVPGAFLEVRDSALGSRCWSGHEVICVGENRIQDTAQVFDGFELLVTPRAAIAGWAFRSSLCRLKLDSPSGLTAHWILNRQMRIEDELHSCCSTEQKSLEHIHDLKENWLLPFEAGHCVSMECRRHRHSSM